MAQPQGMWNSTKEHPCRQDLLQQRQVQSEKQRTSFGVETGVKTRMSYVEVALQNFLIQNFFFFTFE